MHGPWPSEFNPQFHVLPTCRFPMARLLNSGVWCGEVSWSHHFHRRKQPRQLKTSPALSEGGRGSRLSGHIGWTASDRWVKWKENYLRADSRGPGLKAAKGRRSYITCVCLCVSVCMVYMTVGDRERLPNKGCGRSYQQFWKGLWQANWKKNCFWI